MKRILPMVAALGSMLWLSAASGLGLGDIDVRSRLNQRFAASIPLNALTPDEVDTVRVVLASNAEFQRAGIERADYLSSLEFKVVADGNPRIEVSSSQLAREPFLNFLIEVRASSGRLLREYTVLLDPPDSAAVAGSALPSRPVARPAPSQSEFYETAEEAARRPAPAPAPVQPKPAPAQTAPVLTPVTPSAPTRSPAPSQEASAPYLEPTMPAAESLAAGGSYGPVKPGETFWSIATRLRPASGVTMDQMLLALYENNRAAFDGGINGLRQGSTLKVPSLDSIRAVGAAEAKAEVARLRGLPASRSAAPASAPAAPAPASVDKPVVIEPIKPAPAPAAAPQPEPTAPASEPASSPVAPAASAPSEPLVESPAEVPAVDPAVTTEPAISGADPSAETPPAESGAEAPVEPTPAPAPVQMPPVPVAEEPSLLETLLLPLLGGLLVLGGVGYLVSRVMAKKRRSPPPEPVPVPRPRAASKSGTGAAAAAAAATGAAVAASSERKLSTKEQLEQLQDDDLPASGAASAATQQIKTQQVTTQQVATQSFAPDTTSTQLFDEPPPAAPPSEPVDFDLTGQFESQTVQINLDANDPISEADFHLAYGLYDEAALLLKQAATKDPGRTDLQVKLAETYFAAGKAAEFQQTAQALKPRLDAAEWQKLAIMGQQLDPGSSLFKVDAGSAGVEMDLSFDELAAPPTVTPVLPAEPARKAPPPEPQPLLDDGLDFKLEDLELSTLDQAGGDGLALAPDKGQSLEFDLGAFDLGDSPKAPPPPVASAAAPADKGNALEFDLGAFDMPPVEAPAAPATLAAPPAAEPASANTISLDTSSLDTDLDNFDFGDGQDSNAISGDEAGTKLDLARAYIDMGDDDMARSLLGEVMEQGSDAQKQEAQALIARLG